MNMLVNVYKRIKYKKRHTSIITTEFPRITYFDLILDV